MICGFVLKGVSLWCFVRLDTNGFGLVPSSSKEVLVLDILVHFVVGHVLIWVGAALLGLGIKRIWFWFRDSRERRL